MHTCSLETSSDIRKPQIYSPQSPASNVRGPRPVSFANVDCEVFQRLLGMKSNEVVAAAEGEGTPGMIELSIRLVVGNIGVGTDCPSVAVTVVVSVRYVTRTYDKLCPLEKLPPPGAPLAVHVCMLKWVFHECIGTGSSAVVRVPIICTYSAFFPAMALEKGPPVYDVAFLGG